MLRSHFIASLSAALLPAHTVRMSADPEADPATFAPSAALRVLLGKGTAQRIDDTAFFFAGRRYRGQFTTLPDGGVVNTVPLEEYLYSVVSREMPSSWPAGALQAQAIVARTFVLQRSTPRRAYDVVPSEADQVYTGIDAETRATTAAVDATNGQVLRYGDGFAQVMYSSCCGGHTESNADAWGGAPLAYLSGVGCTYCTDSPWYRWTQNVPMQRVRDAFRDRTAQIGDVQDITLDPPDSSGRIRFATIVGTSATLRVKGGDLRRALGTRTLPSLLVKRLGLDQQAAQADQALVIEGAGLGHGVGLCQWGARGYARAGATARAILALYYPGTSIGND